MLPILIIFSFSVLYLQDELGGALGGADVNPWMVLGASLSPLAVLAGVLWLSVLVLERKLNRTGRVRSAALAERLVSWSRIAATVIHVSNVLMLGELGAVRRIVGDLIAFDELLTLTPLLAVWAVGWWAIHPIEQRMREAMILRHLDTGRPIYPLPGRSRYVWVSFRTQVLFVFLPLAGLLTWTEISLRTIAAMPEAWREDWREPAMQTAAHLMGVLGVLLAMPLALRYVWDTVVLGDSPLTRRLEALCATYAVRVRRLLMWRTDGVIVNAAVVGVVRPFRYILMTDALLDQLPTWQIEAVAAHEVAHVKCRHMIWLGVCVLASVIGTGVVAELVLRQLPSVNAESQTVSYVVLGATLLVLLIVFGGASRVFERQADAFAARHMSKIIVKSAEASGDGAVASPEADTPPQTPTFSEGGVAAMAGALRNVALLNGISPERFTWRHGSIAQRIQHLGSLAGMPLGRAPVDRSARLVKWLAGGALIVSLVVMFTGGPVR